MNCTGCDQPESEHCSRCGACSTEHICQNPVRENFSIVHPSSIQEV
jgi:hypothetical protein